MDNSHDKVHGLNAMNGVVTVQAMDITGQIAPKNVVADPGIDVVGPGVDIKALLDDWTTSGTATGASDATAITSGFLAVVKSKYPNATGNQLVQTLIHNTGVEDHELSYDPNNYYGYGTVSLRHMLAVDPTQYPDINPLVNRETVLPSYDDIYGTTPTPTPTPPPTASESPATSGFVVSPIWLVLGGGLVLLLVFGGVTTLIVVLVRRGKKTRTSHGNGTLNGM
jgi:subtilisin family serine protease